MSQFVVVRTHSHTDKQCLWKVMSRTMTDRQHAEDWKEFCESEEKNKKHKFMVVEIL